jgi:hypothetical protein
MSRFSREVGAPATLWLVTTFRMRPDDWAHVEVDSPKTRGNQRDFTASGDFDNLRLRPVPAEAGTRAFSARRSPIRGKSLDRADFAESDTSERE